MSSAGEGRFAQQGQDGWCSFWALHLHLLLTVLAFFLSINLIIPFNWLYLRKHREGYSLDIFFFLLNNVAEAHRVGTTL